MPLQPVEHYYNVRDDKAFYLRKVGPQEVKDFFTDVKPRGIRVEIFKRLKPCCPDEDVYLGSFPAKEVLVKIGIENT